jgi:hypothetical protein
MQIINNKLEEECSWRRWRNPGRFSGALRRITAPLRHKGVIIVSGIRDSDENGTRLIKVMLAVPSCKPGDPGENPAEDKGNVLPLKKKLVIKKKA